MRKIAKTYRRDRANLYANKTKPAHRRVSISNPRRFKVKNLPRIKPGSLLQVVPAGDRVWLAHDRTVEAYTIVEMNDAVVARRISKATLPADTRELMIAR